MAEPVGIRERVAEVLRENMGGTDVRGGWTYIVDDPDDLAAALLEAFPQLAEDPEYEYTWAGSDWVLDLRFGTRDEAAKFGASPGGAWVLTGGKLVRSRRAGEWEEVS